MKRAVWSFGLVALLLAACGDNGGAKDSGPGEPDPAMTLVELVRAEGVPANGSDAAIIRVVARDKSGRPVPNRPVEASSSEPSDEISVEPPRTDRDGVSEIRVTGEKVGTRVISILVNSLAIPQRPMVEFVPGSGEQLGFVEVPTTGKAGRPLRPAIKVEARDAKGNRVMDFDGEVTLHVGDDTTYTEKAVQGVATFSEVVIHQPGEHHVRATAPGFQEAHSQKIDIIVGDPAYLQFRKKPEDVRVGEPFSVSVTIHDAGGNVVLGSNDTVYLRLYSNPTGAKLQGPVAVKAKNGEATFDGLVIDRPSAGYQLTASAPGYVSAESDPFTVLPIDPVKEASYLKIRPEGSASDDADPVAVANGRDRLRIEAKLVDSEGNPLANHPVTLTASGTGHLFHPHAPSGAETLETRTTAAGTVLAWISSTVAEAKVVTLRVGELFELQADAIFTADKVAPTFSELVPSGVTAIADLEDSIRFDVVVKDENGNPIPDHVVGVTVSGTGNEIDGLSGTSVITGPNGVGTFHLRSSKAETKTVVVRMSDDVTFSHDVVFMPGPPDANMSLAVPVSPVRSATVGSLVAEPFAVIVRDKFGNPVPGATVHFEILGVYPDFSTGAQPLPIDPSEAVAQLVYVDGGAAGRTADVVADENGLAEIKLIVEKTAGLNRVAWNGGWSGGPRAFDLEAIGLPDEAVELLVVEPEFPAQAAAGASLPTIKIQARDQHGNLTGDLHLNFTPAGPGGSGSVSPSNPVVLPPWEFPNRQAPTAQVTWTLDATAGENTLTVEAATSSTTLSLVLEATGIAGAPNRIEIVNTTSPFVQVVNNPLDEAFRIRVYDGNDNLVSDGFTARFTIVGFDSAQAHGEFVGHPQGPTADVAIVGGEAEVLYKLGEEAGDRIVEVEVVGSSAPKKTFTVKAEPDSPHAMDFHAGNNQTAKVGERVATDLAVKIVDQYQNPVPNVSVQFAITAAAGPNASLGPDGQEGDTFATETDADGIAAAPFRVGDRPGDYEVTVSAAGLVDLVFEAEAILGDPAAMEVAGGDGQTGTVNQGLTNPLVIVVKDSRGNALPDVEVEFSGVDVEFSTSMPIITDSAGHASASVTRLPEQAGEVEVVASVVNFPSVTATFHLKADPDEPDSVEIVQGHSVSVANAGDIIPAAPDFLVVEARDKYGNPTPGAVVQFFTAPANGGTFLYEDSTGPVEAYPGEVVAGEDGRVQVRWKVPTDENFFTPRVNLKGASMSKAKSFQGVQVVLEPSTLVAVAGDRQRINPDEPFANAVVVRALNVNDIPVPGAAVTFNLSDGTLLAGDTSTDADGYAVANVQAGSLEGTINVTVTLDDFTSVPAASFELVVEESLLCQAVGAATYYVDSSGDLVSQGWTDGEGTFRMAHDDVNSAAAWVSFAEAVPGEPAWGYVHPNLAVDCDGTVVEVVATASGAELTVDGTEADWSDTPPAGVTWSYDASTGLLSIGCDVTPGVELFAYDDGLEHFTRVLADGAAVDALCSNPPVVFPQSP